MLLICSRNNPYDGLAAKGFLDNSYVPENASHLLKDIYKDPNGYWYGIYTGLLGFMVNTDELGRLGLEAPQSWDDLLKPEYKDLIWLSNYKTAGTPKLVANLMIQLKGHDEGIPRTSAPVSASSASASCMTASLRSSTTAMRTSSLSFPLTAPPARSAPWPSSRARPTSTPPVCSWSSL